MKRRKKKTTFSDVLVVAGIATLMGMAIREQLQLPPEERTWHGTYAGIPYDFRMPTLERLRAAYWNKDTTLLLTPQPFGMGWAINFYPLINSKKAQAQE
jgi:hypothetical protein